MGDESFWWRNNSSKIKSFKIVDLAKALNPQKKHKIIGIRAGEKIHEQMISRSDSYHTVEMTNYYAILNNENQKLKKYYKTKLGAKKVREGFEYSSDTNLKFMNLKDLKNLIKNSK